MVYQLGDIDAGEFCAALALPELRDVKDRVLQFNTKATQKAFDHFAEDGEISLERLSDVMQPLPCSPSLSNSAV